MMIVTDFRLHALGALLAGLATPTLAGAPQEQTKAERSAPAASQSAEASRSRRVELPFPLDIRLPDPEPRAFAPQSKTGPHPFRESLLKRASLAAEIEIRGRLSRLGDFS